MPQLKITDDPVEMAELGRRFLLEQPTAYPEGYIRQKTEKFRPFFEDDDTLNAVIYRAVYCQQVYGVSILEYGIYRFSEKNHRQRTEYITWDSRFPYMAFLNKASENHFLDNKYEAYTLLKPFYKRNAMLLSEEGDFDRFCSFVRENPDIFVKPNNLELAEGAHRLTYAEDGDLRKTFHALLTEAKNISAVDVKRKIDHRLILEELIRPSSFIRQINPRELSLLRVTTIFVKGQVHFFYPCLRLLFGDGTEKCGEDYSYVALIDSATGKVVTNGKNGLGDSDVNPVTGLPICGMQMPDWADCKAMLTEAAKRLPFTRYIGWDVTHTEQGWCIIEGNTNGEFFYQMCAGHGLKDEFENLIGFKVPYDFWKSPLLRKRNTDPRQESV